MIAIDTGRVLKAFRRKSHTQTPVINWDDHDAMTKAEFRAEAQAYESLQDFPTLGIFAPKFFGRADPVSVLSDRDASIKYVAGCGLILERIPGYAKKFESLESSFQSKVDKLLERFRNEAGIGNPWDMSCFVPGTRAEFTVIDFAVWDGIKDYQIALNETGQLSLALRSRLESENVG